MIIYIIFLIFLIALFLITYFFVKDEKKRHFLCSLIPAIGLFLMCGLKGASVGADSMTYVNAYNDIASMPKFPNPQFFNELNNFNFKNEYGFILTAVIFTNLNLPYLVFQLFIYAIISFCLFYAIWKMSKCAISSFLIFYCFNFFNFFLSGLRQSFAIALCLLAIAIISTGRKKVFKSILYFVLVAIATLWHKSAIIFIIPYFIINIKIELKGFIVLLSLSLFLLIFGEQMYQVIYETSSIIFNTNGADYPPLSFGAGLTNILFLFILVFCFFFYYPSNIKFKLFNFIESKISFYKKGECSNHNQTSTKMFSFFLLLSFIGLWLRYTNSYSVAFGRIAMYFTIFIIFLLPNALENISNYRLKNSIKGILCVAFVAYFVYTFVLTNYLGVAPYNFIEGTL